MHIVVFTEYHIDKVMLVIHQREGIELVIPDNIVGLFQGRICWGGNQLFIRRHKITHQLTAIHTGNAVVTAGDNAKKSAV